MQRDSVTIPVSMDAKQFRRFGLFDTFILRRRWLSPAVFSAIFIAFSVLCFSLTDKEQSALLGSVLLAVGIGLPACYFLNFFLQLNSQVKRLSLQKPKLVYTLNLSKTDVHIINNMKEEAEVVLPWENVMGIWRGQQATYLYATASRAFILPDGQGDLSPSELWSFLEECLPKEKLHGQHP